MKLLALDTAGSVSSAAAWASGHCLARAEFGTGHHGEQALALIDRVLVEAGVALRELDAIAFGRGPGAFTGVRLAVGLAQGLAYSTGLPVIPVSNLAAAAQRAFGLEGAPERRLVCQDARRHEVYWACYLRGDAGPREASAEAVGPPADVALAEEGFGEGAAWGIGTGFDAYPALREALGARLRRVLTLESRAEDVAALAERWGPEAAIDPMHAVPRYLRDDVAVPPVAGA